MVKEQLYNIFGAIAASLATEIVPKAIKAGSEKCKSIVYSPASAFKHYLITCHERYCKIKTLLYRDHPVLLRDHYVSSSFKYKNTTISGNDILEEFLNKKRNVVTGTAGSGKTILLRRLFLDLAEEDMGVFPVMVELRLIGLTDVSDCSIISFIHKCISNHSEQVDLNHLRTALEKGKLVLLLDGLDEIEHSIRKKYEQEILEISSKYTKTAIVVSSRPDDCFGSWEEFHTYRTLPLSETEAADLISRIDYDNNIKDKFSEVLPQLYERHKDFLSNPLLLTMMLLTYEQLAEIPEKIHIFYEQAFETLFHKHDAQKSLYKRKSYTGLPIDDFKHLFSAFCIITYSEKKFTLSENETIEYIKQANVMEGTNVDPQDFLRDLMESVCIIQKDGNYYTFTHRSFQEYFTAYYMSKSQSMDVKEVLDTIASTYFTDFVVISMLFELNKEQVEKNWVLPTLREIASLRINPLDGQSVVAVLKKLYDRISISNDNGVGFGIGPNVKGGAIFCIETIYESKLKDYLEKKGIRGGRIVRGRSAIRKEVEILKRHFVEKYISKNEGLHFVDVDMAEIEGNSAFLKDISKTTIPEYFAMKIEFASQLMHELESKYAAKEKSLKELLASNLRKAVK